MEIYFVYITVGNKQEAEAIGRYVVEARLAACVNILDGMNSIYYWNGELQSDHEVVMIAKTTAERMDDLIEAVKKMHSYDCPCIISLPVIKGNEAYLQWIQEQVQEKPVNER